MLCFDGIANLESVGRRRVKRRIRNEATRLKGQRAFVVKLWSVIKVKKVNGKSRSECKHVNKQLA